eukprot:TRINITY_DN12825_c0_g1_i3.p1 TRINITY_DN12825_c0_g1~~TRINITY_DN12825_c0_g1_i3.p1  ORF type:complete len:451 (+),score=154.13 TRINITY_DN12825_c0_g1_i3:203-1555(+)
MMEPAIGSMTQGRTVGLTLHMGSLFTIILAASAFVEFSMMTSDESWWEMCDTVPCNAQSMPASHIDLQTCANPAESDTDSTDDAALALRLISTGGLNYTQECSSRDLAWGSKACSRYICSALKDSLVQGLGGGGCSSGDECRDYEDVACLKQMEMSNGQYITFGSLCCTACAFGARGDLEAVFRSWAAEWQHCGVFTCKANGHTPQRDFCHDRRAYARSAQAFTVLSFITLVLLALFHVTELNALKRPAARRLPLPRCLVELRETVRGWAHWLHYLCGMFSLLAAVFLVSTLSLEFCGERYANYVRPLFGVRAMWGIMCLVVMTGCYYHLSVIGYTGVSRLVLQEKLARQTTTAVPIGAMSDNPTESLGAATPPPAAPADTPSTVPQSGVSDRPIGNVQLTAPPAVAAAAVDEPMESTGAVEMHDVRLSPKEGEVEAGDGAAPPATLALS